MDYEQGGKMNLLHPMKGALGFFLPTSSCAFSTKECRKFCIAKKEPMVDSAALQYAFNAIYHWTKKRFINQILREARNQPAIVIHWFGSGDVPKDKEDLFFETMISIGEAGIPQCGFTRNAYLYSKVNFESIHKCELFFTKEVETPQKDDLHGSTYFGPSDAILSGYNGFDGGVIRNLAIPDYPTGIVNLWKMGPSGKIRLSAGGCGGGRVFEGTNYNQVTLHSNGCWDCWNKKVGCFYQVERLNLQKFEKYSSSIISLAVEWSELMEIALEKGESLKSCAIPLSKKTKTYSWYPDHEELSEAVTLLSQTWKYGEELQRMWNK